MWIDEPPGLANFRFNISWCLSHLALQGVSLRVWAKEHEFSHPYLCFMRSGNIPTQRTRPIIPKIDNASRLARAFGFDLRHATVPHAEFLRRTRKKPELRLTSADPVHNFRKNFQWLYDHDPRSIRKLAEDIKMAYPYLSRIKSGSIIAEQGTGMIPTLYQAERVAAAYGVSLHDILLDSRALPRVVLGKNFG